ncbi:Type I restriction modification DNA specificity domain protein [Rubripirellula lacrimiformis]|uniref:Type I restriction modification DNA specificity domain protein n=1 Tax=Rubripirellula lacrimiformis TaxID=1930273 RepID=A0A517NDL4_9BACT|nr:restriction endonuclease subunit S [Rubripirellula lacrimiformis]QDT05230.1 Type I restriction modification DNA specificity domain protein [Rubripirellula lacrimiformis]
MPLISDIAEVRMGYHFRGRVQEEPGGNALVLQIRDVDEDGRFDPEALTPMEIPNLPNHALSAGDAVFLARGARRYAFLFDAVSHDNIVPAGYFMVLRANHERVRPGYLAWAINQDRFQALIDSVSAGTAVPQITKSNLTRLSIDVPDLQTQDRIAAIDSLMKRERTLMQHLTDRRSALLRAAARGADD